MKITFAGMVFNGDHFLEQCIAAVKPFGRVVFAEGPTRYWCDRGFATSTDATNAILKRLIGEKNVCHGQFEEKDDEARATEALIPDDTDFVWWIDSDEVWRQIDICRVIELLETDRYDSVAFKADSFYAGFDHILTGWERQFEVHRIQKWHKRATWATHRPPTINAPDGKPWREHRHLSHDDTEVMGITMPHYSYVYPSQVIAKAAYYDAYDRTLCIPNYVTRVFWPWLRGTEDERAEIEKQWNGVHNFMPNRRGPTFTAPFAGQHPETIVRDMARLKRRLRDESRAYPG